jgi:hypothetical protein
LPDPGADRRRQRRCRKRDHARCRRPSHPSQCSSFQSRASVRRCAATDQKAEARSSEKIGETPRVPAAHEAARPLPSSRAFLCCARESSSPGEFRAVQRRKRQRRGAEDAEDRRGRQVIRREASSRILASWFSARLCVLCASVVQFPSFGCGEAALRPRRSSFRWP